MYYTTLALFDSAYPLNDIKLWESEKLEQNDTKLISQT